MNSALFVGSVRHRRFSPIRHSFTYPMFMPLIDLDELDELQRSVIGFGQKLMSFARFRAADYLRGHKNNLQPHAGSALKQAVLDKVEELTGERLEGRVMLLCQLRYAGIYFSPLNLYYLYDQNDEWRWVLAEVSNTPWNERHYYVLPAQELWHEDTWLEEKSFHVSPFNPMEQQYYWRLSEPEKQLMLHLDIHSAEDHSKEAHSTEAHPRESKKVLDATLSMKRRPFTSKELWRLLIKTPIQTVKVVIGIYWQALRLWLKKAPFYSHPAS